MADKQIKCVVVTPERTVLDETADAVVIPMFDGELGVLVDRAPMIGRLGFGELRLTQAGKTRRFYIDGGFAQVRENTVNVLTSRAVAAADLKVADIEKQMESARKAKDVPAEKNLALLSRGYAQLRVARHASSGT